MRMLVYDRCAALPHLHALASLLILARFAPSSPQVEPHVGRSAKKSQSRGHAGLGRTTRRYPSLTRFDERTSEFAHTMSLSFGPYDFGSSYARSRDAVTYSRSVSTNAGPTRGFVGQGPDSAQAVGKQTMCVWSRDECYDSTFGLGDTGLVSFACLFGILSLVIAYYIFRRRAKLEYGFLLLSTLRTYLGSPRSGVHRLRRRVRRVPKRDADHVHSRDVRTAVPRLPAVCALVRRFPHPGCASQISATKSARSACRCTIPRSSRSCS